MKGLVRTVSISMVLLLGGIAAAPAAAAPPASKPVAPVQLGLGDSWAWGFGASVPSEDGYVAQLHQVAQGELNCSGAGPAQSQAGCKHLGLQNMAVPGATTPSMVAGQFPAAIALLEARNGNRNPRDDVELTTISIGGNDVTNPIIAACLGGITPACLQVIDSEFTAYRSDLDGALATLREAAGDEATIVLGTYDNGIGSCNLGLVPGAVLLADLVLEGGGPISEGLHDIMRDVAGDHGVVIAEVYGDLGPGDWVGGADCLHPNDSGYDKVTDAFSEALGLG